MTGNATESDRILGSLRSTDGTGIVRMEDRLDADIDDVWSALTDPGRLARWLGEFQGGMRPGASSAHASLRADGKARDAWKRSRLRGGCC